MTARGAVAAGLVAGQTSSVLARCVAAVCTAAEARIPELEIRATDAFRGTIAVAA